MTLIMEQLGNRMSGHNANKCKLTYIEKNTTKITGKVLDQNWVLVFSKRCLKASVIYFMKMLVQSV